MSLLTIVQSACDRMGIVRPSSVIGSTDQQVRQLQGLAQEEVTELARRHPWQAITKETTFVTIAQAEQTGVIPTDFDRLINESVFNRTAHRRVEGPLEAIEWQRFQAMTITLVWDAFRIRGNAFLITPTPSAGSTYAFEYVSTYTIRTAAGTTGSLTTWTADDNAAMLSEELITDGVVWRFLKAKGMDYSEAFRTYELQVMLATARDAGKRTVNMGRAYDYRRPRLPTFPDGSWSIT